MAKFQFRGINEFAQKLYALSDQSETMIKRAVYDGAKVVADAVRAEMKKIPEIPDYFIPEAFRPVGGITKEQKAGLEQSFGLAEIKNENGYINTKIGFSGYNGHITPTFPIGEPNVLIARSLQSGTTLRRKYPFVTFATRAAKKECEAAMAARFDEDTKQIMQ